MPIENKQDEKQIKNRFFQTLPTVELIKSTLLSGFEFASGIPGTIGGAIKMNAGAYGGEIKDIVSEVTYMDYEGNVYTIGNLEKSTNWKLTFKYFY